MPYPPSDSASGGRGCRSFTLDSRKHLGRFVILGTAATTTRGIERGEDYSGRPIGGERCHYICRTLRECPLVTLRASWIDSSFVLVILRQCDLLLPPQTFPAFMRKSAASPLISCARVKLPVDQISNCLYVSLKYTIFLAKCLVI